MIDQFFTEYWMFVEALLLHASDLVGVGTLNAAAAILGYPFLAALALSVAGITAALGLFSLGRPGWGLAGLAVGEELSALSLATAAGGVDFGDASKNAQAFARKSSCSALKSTGLVRWWSKPTAAVRARSCTWPYPVMATIVVRSSVRSLRTLAAIS